MVSSELSNPSSSEQVAQSSDQLTRELVKNLVAEILEAERRRASARFYVLFGLVGNVVAVLLLTITAFTESLSLTIITVAIFYTVDFFLDVKWWIESDLDGLSKKKVTLRLASAVLNLLVLGLITLPLALPYRTVALIATVLSVVDAVVEVLNARSVLKGE